MELANFRAYTAPFNEAFAAPRAFLHDDIYSTSNNPTPLEHRLAKEFKRQKEPELVAAVLGGRKFHRVQDALRRTSPPTIADVNLMRTAFNLPSFPDLDHWRGNVLHYGAGHNELAWFTRHFVKKAEEFLKADVNLNEWQLFMAEVTGLLPTFKAVKTLKHYIPWLEEAQVVAEASIYDLKEGRAKFEANGRSRNGKRAQGECPSGDHKKRRLEKPNSDKTGRKGGDFIRTGQGLLSGTAIAPPPLPKFVPGSLFNPPDPKSVDKHWLQPYFQNRGRCNQTPVSRVHSRTAFGEGDLREPSVWDQLASDEFNLCANDESDTL